MADYSEITAALVHKTRAREEVLGLRDKTCQSQFFLQDDRSDRVLLFFHGFTAIPQQFAPIAAAFFKAGYNVLIPLLPGHGQAGDWTSENPPPLPENQLIYQEFGLQWLAQAQQLGDRVVVGGLSGGSTLAAWLSLESPQAIDRALLFAPYLSSTNPMIDWCVKHVDIYFEWKTAPGAVNLGYPGFHMPALRVFLEMGQTVLDRAATHPVAPLFIVSSEDDSAVGSAEHQELFQAALQSQPKCWYHRFDHRLHIPHNMMTIAEGNPYRDLVIAVAQAYLESDLTWAEVEAIRYRLSQGFDFEGAIAQLHLTSRTSPHLLAMLTSDE